jgi:phage N-6-adenine-methyltransferase
MTEPAQKRGKSKQDYGTPPEFLVAVTRLYGPIAFDLAAHEGNHVVPDYFAPKHDSLKQEWSALDGNLWLNPPFANIEPWASKCAETELRTGARILFLVPAAVGSNWFRDHVHRKALVIGLNGRLKFDGVHGYPKDCALCVFGESPGFKVWDWRRKK